VAQPSDVVAAQTSLQRFATESPSPPLRPSLGALEAVYRDAYDALRRRAVLRGREVRFRVRFYPYVGLKSTIRQRESTYHVRLADLLETAPLSVHYSLACILLSKIDRRLRLDRAQRESYESWARTRTVIEAHENSRRERGRKDFDPPQGRFHDLVPMFHALNRQYFGSLLPPVRLGWTRGRSRSLWGHQDPAHETIVLNRVLDSPRVPPFVVASILFHEMLHHKHGVQYGPRGRRIVHSRAMRAEERTYAHYDEAHEFLQRVAERRIRL
jgi:hypothetical protein